MDEQNQNRSAIPTISGLILALAALGFFTFKDLPLKGSRPDRPEVPLAYPALQEDVLARLWEDPFDAVSKYEKAQGLEAGDTLHSFNRLLCQIDSRPDLFVLFVMANGGPYAEDAEWRLRYRYALVSALGRLNYVPDDSTHIGYVHFKKTQAFEESHEGSRICENVSEELKKTKIHTKPMIIPYEWFQLADGKSPPSILCLWLNASDFDSDPLTGLGTLVQSIRSVRSGEDIRFRLLGPIGSRGVVAMLKELKKAKKKESIIERLKGIEIYSSNATASDRILIREYTENNQADPNVHEQFSKHDINFFRTILTDDKLAEALVAELEERDIPLEQGESHVALVGEWDTFYARALTEEFEKKLDEHIEKKNSARKPSLKAKDIIHKFNYLRGIDGKIPKKPDTKAGKVEDTVPQEEERAFRRPVGPGQFDYLRRMAESIAQCNERLMRDNKGSIKAIGILGSDLYDKLLTLQAFKPRFPTAIFFTTDLDARFLHPSNSKWSRNLVVASNFGLALNREIQGSIPPFRDNYQASLFLTTLIALHRITDANGDPWPREHIQERIDVLLGEPRVFEIGLGRAFDLSSPGVERSSKSHTTEKNNNRIDDKRFENIHPQRIAEAWGKTIRGGLALSLALALSCVCISRLGDTTQHAGGSLFADAGFLILTPFCAAYSMVVLPSGNPVGALLLPVALTLVYFSFQNFRNLTRHALSFISNHPIFSTTMAFLFVFILYVFSKKLSLALEKEPFAFLEGVSVWPTELIRLMAFVTAVCLSFRAWFLLKHGNKKVAREFGLDYEEPTQPYGCSDRNPDQRSLIDRIFKWTKEAVHSIHPWWTDLSIDHWGKDRKDEEMPVERVWQEYISRSSLKKRLVRTLPMVLLYFLFVGFLPASLGRPVTPARGDATFIVDRVIIMLAVFALVPLVFFVVDATRLCHRFIDQIVHNRRIWISCKPSHNEASLGQWRIIQLIAEMTDPVGRLILYPFVVFFLLIVSRLSLFDNWHYPKTLIVVISIGLLYAVGCAFRIRRAAERARGKVVEELRQQLVRLSPEDSAKGLGDRIRTIIQVVTSNRTGAFQHLSRHPLVKAVLLPFGGIGGVALLEYLASGPF